MVNARTLGFFVDGQWRTDGKPVNITSPFDGSLAGATFEAAATHLELAVNSALRCFEITRRLPGYERNRVLEEVSQGIASRREEFARVMALESGKPLKTARIEVDRAIFTFHVAAEETLRIEGEWMSLDWQPAAAGRSAVLRSFPLGPIAAITPFNFPLNLGGPQGCTGNRGGLHYGAEARSEDAVVCADAGRIGGAGRMAGRRVECIAAE